MADERTFAPSVYSGDLTVGSFKNRLGLRDGSAVNCPWVQMLVFEGRVFGINVGNITTPITGHTSVDGDQPEAAVAIPQGTAALPISLVGTIETGSATLGVGGLMFAVSQGTITAGTSTAVTPLNWRLDAPRATTALAYTAYSGNMTADPLTSGQWQELIRQQFTFDSDAATSGFVVPKIEWSALRFVAPVVIDNGGILFYGEHANNAPSVYAEMAWAEFSDADMR